MIQSILDHLAASMKKNASIREIAGLTDRQFADIGGDRLDGDMLDKARRLRAREYVPFQTSIGAFLYPTA